MEVQEQREFERFDLRIPAKIEAVTPGQEKDKEILNLLTKDICAGGAFFHTAQPLPEGTEVKIDLVLDINKLKKLTGSRSHIRVKGRVSRSESEGMAICFYKHYKITAL